MNRKGFTLVELMVVIVIVGILAAVAIPKFTMAAHKAKASEFPTVLTQMYTAECAYQAETGTYTDQTTLQTGGGLSVSPSKFFEYAITLDGSGTPSSTNFHADARVKEAFGNAIVNQKAYIDQDGIRGFYSSPDPTDGLQKYATSWAP
jgi:prepilin-type N-terminal cleavage/methylation domain